MKRLVLLAAAALAGSALSPVDVAGAAAPQTEHLPDLTTRPPSDVRIDTSRGGKLLRFSNVVANLGDGRFELRPQHNRAGGLLGFLFSSSSTTRAYQGIYTHDGNGNWRKVREQFVGTFKFHPSHDHWHFEKFAKYELFRTNADGSRGASVNRVSEKTTFCVIDTDEVDLSLEHASQSKTYTTCGRNDTTGLSVGWGDKYGYWLDGQWIDVQGIPNGTYWLVSTVDYGNKLVESDDGNNEGAVKVRITDNSATVVE